MKKLSATATLAAVVIALATPVLAQSPGESQGLENVMSAGADHEVLDSMVGTFDVQAKTWADPTAPPVEGTLTATNTWVVDNHYLRMTLDGNIDGDVFSGIGYLGFDLVREGYEMVWMDTVSAGMIWYRGEFDSSGKHMTMRAEVPNPSTGSPSMVEMRTSIQKGGDHVTEVWIPGPGNMMFKTKELRYTRNAQ